MLMNISFLPSGAESKESRDCRCLSGVHQGWKLYNVGHAPEDKQAKVPGRSTDACRGAADSLPTAWTSMLLSCACPSLGSTVDSRCSGADLISQTASVYLATASIPFSPCKHDIKLSWAHCSSPCWCSPRPDNLHPIADGPQHDPALGRSRSNAQGLL